MNWTLNSFQTSDTSEWDDFINSQTTGSIHQSTIWKSFQEKIPGREQVLGFYALDENKHWIGATWCVKMSTGFANTHWYYSARGPVLSVKDAAFRAEFLERVSVELKAHKGLFWRLDPYWPESDWREVNQASSVDVKAATKNFQPTDSLMLDLKLSEEAILAQMHRQGRKALKLADNAEVEVKIISGAEATSEDINVWQDLNQDTTKRDGFAGHDAVYYQNFLSTLGSYASLFVATHQKKPIAAAILTVYQQKAIYYFGASSSEPSTRQLRAPYALQWAMIRKAKALGAVSYDFTGITPADQPDHPYKGITQFKTRFGGYRATYASGKEIPLNPFWYRLYRLVKQLKS